jgi:hypothetical protein
VSVVVGTIRYAGDFTLNSSLGVDDLPAMLRALTDLPGYQSQRGLSNAEMLAIGDLNGDGQITNADIQGLLNRLASQGSGSGSAASETPKTVAQPATVATIGPTTTQPSVMGAPLSLIRNAAQNKIIGSTMPGIIQAGQVSVLPTLSVNLQARSWDRSSALTRRTAVATVGTSAAAVDAIFGLQWEKVLDW